MCCVWGQVCWFGISDHRLEFHPENYFRVLRYGLVVILNVRETVLMGIFSYYLISKIAQKIMENITENIKVKQHSSI